MEADLLAYIDRLQACPSLDDAWQAICDFAAAREMPRVGCCYGAARAGQPMRKLVVRANFSPGFGKRWSTDLHFQHDPVVPRAFASPKPFFWGSDYLGKDIHPSVSEYYLEAQQDGARSLLVVPLRCDPARGIGLGFVANSLPGPLFEQQIKQHETTLVLALLYTDIRMTILARALPKTPAKLGPREAECLQLLTSGLKNETIAQQLGISKHTVQLHLDSARRKLGAATREQAIAKAINFRLIRS